MKFLVTSDTHFRDDKPRCRVDNFFETQQRKLRWLIEQVNEHECPLFIAGDIMDSGSATQRLENMLIREFKKAKYPVYSIAGNHDVHYHSIKHLHNSTYWVLHQAGAIQHISDTDIITAFNYGEEIQNGTGILMMHALVFENNPPPYLANAYKASDLLDKFNYSIILSGDNHQSFYVEHNNKVLINGGGLFRTEYTQKYNCPTIYLYDGKVHAIQVPVHVQDVVQEYAINEKERDDRVLAFINRVQVSKEIGLSFIDNIDRSIKETNMRQPVVEIVHKAIKGELA
jgi:predicted phosphodiesterase